MITPTKRHFLTFIGALLTAFPVTNVPTCAFAEPTAVGNDDEQTLVSLEKGWSNAYLTDNAAFLDGLMDPGFVLTNAHGQVSAKDEEVAEVRDRTLHYDQFESSDLKVRLYDDTAVVTGQTHIKASVKKLGHVIDGMVRFTDTFVRRNGKWQIIASQTTLLPAKS